MIWMIFFLLLWQGKRLRTTEKEKINSVWDSKLAADTSLALFSAMNEWQRQFNTVQIMQRNLDYDWLMSNRVWSWPIKEIFCFQIKRAPCIAQFMAYFFPSLCAFLLLDYLNIFSCILISNHMISSAIWNK